MNAMRKTGNIESKFLQDKHNARQIAFQALFQLDFNRNSNRKSHENRENQELSDEMTLAIDLAIGEAEDFNEDMRSYVEQTVQGTQKYREQIDELITKFSTGWNIRRMTSVDRNLLRLAIYEMKFADKPLSPAIVIDEIVELAKIFGSDESPKFVNGLLGAFSRDGKPRDSKDSKTKSEKQSQT